MNRRLTSLWRRRGVPSGLHVLQFLSDDLVRYGMQDGMLALLQTLTAANSLRSQACDLPSAQLLVALGIKLPMFHTSRFSHPPVKAVCACLRPFWSGPKQRLSLSLPE